MSTSGHDDSVSTESTDQAVAFEVEIADEGRVATLVVPTAVREALSRDEAMRRALDALLRSGVVHGLDRAHVAEVVAACEGVPRVVARATPPVLPVDGVIELHFAEGVESDPLHTVDAGTLLARRTPARLGSDGVAVTGEPLASPDPQSPALSAGEGVERSSAGEGVVVVRSLVAGRPRIDGGRVSVDEVLRAPRLARRPDPIELFGSLEVGGDLFAGARVAVSGDLSVGGDVEKATIRSGGGVRIGGSCFGSEVHAGALACAHGLLLERLRGADADLVSASAVAGQLLDSAAGTGRRLSEWNAMKVVLSGRFPAVGPSLAATAAGLEEAGGEVEEWVADAILRASVVVAALSRGEPVGMERVTSCAHNLARAGALMRSAAGRGSGVQADYMQACRVEALGSLVLTGAGTFNVDAEVAGDLLAEAPGGIVRGGTLHVGGELRTEVLGSPGGAPLRVTLAGSGGLPRLTAQIAHPGVEVVCGDRTIVLETTALNFSVGHDEDNNVVCSEDPRLG